MATPKREKENMLKKLKQGKFTTCSKTTTATALWWKRFVQIKDDKENIIPFVQCIKCLSILAYDSNKLGSSSHKTHAEACLDSDVRSSSRNQDISVMINKDDHVSAAAKVYSSK